MPKRSYKVVGSQPIVDDKGQSHPPGEEFAANYDPGDEAFLLSIGAIEKAKSTKDKADKVEEK